ncbi:MAG TPA: hypothetical protein ENF80_01075 [Thermofilum sp.]|nr:hypothetical protein [Thermofilum sp.]
MSNKLIGGLSNYLKEKIEGLQDLLEMSNAEEILRRYFVMNAFDGALTMLGLVVGTYMSGSKDPNLILSAGLGASFAMGVSGFVGALITEKAERERKVKELEHAMLTKLNNSLIDKASDTAVILAALTDSMAPMMAALISASPYLLSKIGLINFDIATYFSVSITLALVFSLGLYLGKVSKGNMILYGIYMLLAGLAISLLILLNTGLGIWIMTFR